MRKFVADHDIDKDGRLSLDELVVFAEEMVHESTLPEPSPPTPPPPPRPSKLSKKAKALSQAVQDVKPGETLAFRKNPVTGQLEPSAPINNRQNSRETYRGDEQIPA